MFQRCGTWTLTQSNRSPPDFIFSGRIPTEGLQLVLKPVTRSGRSICRESSQQAQYGVPRTESQPAQPLFDFLVFPLDLRVFGCKPDEKAPLDRPESLFPNHCTVVFSVTMYKTLASKDPRGWTKMVSAMNFAEAQGYHCSTTATWNSRVACWYFRSLKLADQVLMSLFLIH